MMDETKKAEVRAMLAVLHSLFPDVKSFEQLEAEAADCQADLRSYCVGYFQGAKDGIDLSQKHLPAASIPRRAARDITNLWGLIP